MKSLVRLYAYVRPYRIKAATALILLFGMVVADLLIPHLTQRIIDQGIVPHNLHVVITTAFVMVGAAILSAAFAVAKNYLSVSVATSFGADIRSALFRKVQSFSFGNLDRLREIDPDSPYPPLLRRDGRTDYLRRNRCAGSGPSLAERRCRGSPYYRPRPGTDQRCRHPPPATRREGSVPGYLSLPTRGTGCGQGRSPCLMHRRQDNPPPS